MELLRGYEQLHVIFTANIGCIKSRHEIFEHT